MLSALFTLIVVVKDIQPATSTPTAAATSTNSSTALFAGAAGGGGLILIIIIIVLFRKLKKSGKKAPPGIARTELSFRVDNPLYSAQQTGSMFRPFYNSEFMCVWHAKIDIIICLDV